MSQYIQYISFPGSSTLSGQHGVWWACWQHGLVLPAGDASLSPAPGRAALPPWYAQGPGGIPPPVEEIQVKHVWSHFTLTLLVIVRDAMMYFWNLHTSGTQGLRFEKLPEEWFDYNMAFPTVTNFYSAPQDKTSENYDAARMAEGIWVKKNRLICLGGVFYFCVQLWCHCISVISLYICDVTVYICDTVMYYSDVTVRHGDDVIISLEWGSTLSFWFLALQVSIHLPPSALCCLGALINHLKAFKLQRVLTLTR